MAALLNTLSFLLLLIDWHLFLHDLYFCITTNERNSMNKKGDGNTNYTKSKECSSLFPFDFLMLLTNQFNRKLKQSGNQCMWCEKVQHNCLHNLGQKQLTHLIIYITSWHILELNTAQNDLVIDTHDVLPPPHHPKTRSETLAIIMMLPTPTQPPALNRSRLWQK